MRTVKASLNATVHVNLSVRFGARSGSSKIPTRLYQFFNWELLYVTTMDARMITSEGNAHSFGVQSAGFVMATESLSAEEEVYLKCSLTDDVTKINIGKGSEYVHNSRSQRLHVRTHWPVDGKPKAIIVYLHGYAAHSNRPGQTYMSSQFTEKGFGYVCFDFHGHGYSEGLRALVSSLDNLLDDCLSLLSALYSDEGYADESSASNRKKFHLKNYAQNVPFFIFGHSMGGSTAVALGHYISDKTNDFRTNDDKKLLISNHFSGCLLFCPAIDVKVPAPIIVTIMDYLIVPIFGHYSVPEFIQPTSSNRHEVWRNPHYTTYIQRDGYPANPSGLGFCLPIRFQTGSTLLKLAAKCKEIMREIDYPFIIFHDPKDRVVLFNGSKQMLELSKTKEENKSLVIVENGLHDLITNEMILLTSKSIIWIEKQLIHNAINK